MTMVAFKRRAQPGVIRWWMELHATRKGIFHLLQHHDISVMAENFRDGQLKIDGRVVGICIIPALAELHIELKDFEYTHGYGTVLSNNIHDRSKERRVG